MAAGLVSVAAPDIAAAASMSASSTSSTSGATTTSSTVAVPSAPFLENTTPEGLAILVTWAPDPPGQQVSGYTIATKVSGSYKGTVSSTCSSIATVSASSGDTSQLVTGLCAGIPYIESVSATNAGGTSKSSNPSGPTVPLAAQPSDAPVLTSILGRADSLVVNWTPPDYDGGSTLTGYSLTATAGSSTVTTTAAASTTTVTISGLTNGTVYSVSLVATNAVGSSQAATGSGTPKVAYKPAAPSGLTVVPSGSSSGLTASWNAPTDDGGDAISGYVITYQQEVESSKGVWTTTGTSTSTSSSSSTTSMTISSLNANDFYKFSVAAVNAVGTGPATVTKTPVTPSTTLTSTAVVLTSQTLSELTSDSGGVLTFASPADSQVQSLAKGNILVAATAAALPQGLLAKVTNIATTSSGAYVVTTKQAELTDAFKALSLDQFGNPLQSGTTTSSSTSAGPSAPAAHFVATSSGVRATSVGGSLGTLSLSYDVASGTGCGDNNGTCASIATELDLTPSVSLSGELTDQFPGVPNGATLSASATLETSASVTASFSGSWSHQLGELDFAPIDVQIGPVPLILVPKIPVFVTLSGGIAVGFSGSFTVGAGMTWNSHNPNALSVTNLSTPAHLHGGPLPGVSATATASLSVNVQPQIEIYDATGPNVEATAAITANVNFLPSPGQPYFELDGQLSLGAGWDIDLAWGPISYHKTFDFTLASLTFPVFKILNAPNATLTVSPTNTTVALGSSVTFSATRSDGKTDPITWTMQGEAKGDQISSAGVFTPVAPSGRTVTVIAQDSTGATGETTVTIGKPFDAPGGLSVTTSDTDPTSAAVSWGLPPNTGGGSLSSYVITLDPTGSVQRFSSTTTSTTLTKLLPGTSYVLSLYALNSAGQESSANTTYFTTPNVCIDNWTGPSGGSWSTAANWSGGYVPGPSNWACITNGDSVNVANAVSIAGLEMDGGTLSGSNVVTVTDIGRFDNATLSGIHLVNDGTVTDSGVTLSNSAELENAASLDLGNFAYIQAGDSTSDSLVNDAAGTITDDAGDTESISLPFSDSGAVEVSGSTLDISGATTLSGSPTFGGSGTVSVSGGLSVPSAVSLTNPSGTFDVRGTVSGPGVLTVPSGSTITLDGATLSGIHLVNDGTVNVTNSDVTLSNSAELENAASLDLGDYAYIQAGDSTSDSLVNDAAGTITDDAGDTESISVPFTDSGAVEVSGSTLDISGATTLSGSPTFGGSGTVNLTGTLSAPAGISLSDVGGTLDISGTLDGSGVVTIPALSSVVLEPDSSVYDAHLINRGSLTIATVSYGCYGVALKDNSEIENAGAMAIGDGSCLESGDDTANSLVNDSGATITYNGATSATVNVPFTNNGTLTVSEGTLDIYNPATLSGTLTFASGTVNLESSMTMSVGIAMSGPGTIKISSGSLTVPAGFTWPDAQVTLDDYGTIDGSGKLTMPASSTLILEPNSSLHDVHLVNDGALTIAPITYGCYYVSLDDNSEIENARTMTIGDGSCLTSGDDTANSLVNDNGGTVTYNGGTGATFTLPFTNKGSLTVSGGTLNLGGPTTLAGKVTFASGSLDLGNATSMSAGITMSGPGTIKISNGSLTVPAAFTWPDPQATLDSYNGAIDGSGKLTMPASSTLILEPNSSLHDVQLVNDGALTIAPVAYGCYDVSLDDNSEIENAGTMTIGDGSCLTSGDDTANSLVNDSGSTVTYNGGSGATVSVPFTNGGTLTVSGGTLNLGSFTESTTAALELVLGPISGLLSSSGAVSLAGSLGLSLAPSFAPKSGQTFAVVSDNSQTGSFSSVTYPATSGYSIAYGSSSTTVTYN
ncbi:MAG: beta strand repeat-containing protein [Acidimicrobiales bacterium]